MGSHHARNYAAIPGFKPRGRGGSRTPISARKAAERTAAGRSGSVEELLRWSRESKTPVHAASVAVPTIYHRSAAELLAPAGVNLLIEKPLAPNVADAARHRRTRPRPWPRPAGRPHGALQPRLPGPEKIRSQTRLRRSPPHQPHDLPLHRRGRGAGHDDPRHRHRRPPGQLRDRGVTAVGVGGHREVRGHRQRPPHLRQRLRRQPHRLAPRPQHRTQDAPLLADGLRLPRLPEKNRTIILETK